MQCRSYRVGDRHRMRMLGDHHRQRAGYVPRRHPRGVGGRIIGQAMVCGVSRDRLQQTGTRLLERMTAAAADANERSYVIDLYTQATMIGGQMQKEGNGDPCPAVHDAFDGLERQLSSQVTAAAL